MFIVEKDFIETVDNKEVIIFVHNVTVNGISSIKGNILDIENRQELKRFSIGYAIVEGCMIDELNNLTNDEYNTILNIWRRFKNYDIER